tara:strand:- start:782 stop:928 length:147 start_codon:yes stop_codon:yes gene_type:complete
VAEIESILASYILGNGALRRPVSEFSGEKMVPASFAYLFLSELPWNAA